MANPEILVRFNKETKGIEIHTSITDIDMVMSMLIDALQGMAREKARQKRGGILLAKPNIVTPKPT